MITREKLENNTLTLSVKYSKDVWEKALGEAYDKTKGKYNIQGFRKGKAPRKVIEKNYGDTVFYDDAFDMLVSREYGEFLANNTDLEPIENPHVIINSITLDGVDAKLTVILMPEVKLGKYEGIKVERKVEEVTDKDVEKKAEELANRNARFVESDKEAENGDFATIDFSGSVDGVKFDGGTAEDYRLELGSHSFIDNFEEQIVGMKKGDEKDIKVMFPSEYPAKELAGKLAVFAIKLKKLEKKEISALTDKFISDTTEFESLQEYKKDVRAKLVDEAEKRADQKAEAELVKKIVEGAKIDLPKPMIDHELEHIIEDLKRDLSYQGITLDQYLEFTKMSLDDIKERKRAEAENNLKTRLVFQTIMKENQIQITQEEYESKIEEFATRAGKTVAEFDKEISDYERAYVQNDILITKLFNFLKEKNNIV